MQNIHQRRAKGPAYNIDSCDLLQTSPRNSHWAAPWTTGSPALPQPSQRWVPSAHPRAACSTMALVVDAALLKSECSASNRKTAAISTKIEGK